MSERFFTEAEVSETLNHMIVELAEFSDNWLCPISGSFKLKQAIALLCEVESELEPPAIPPMPDEQVLAAIEAKKDYEELAKAA